MNNKNYYLFLVITISTILTSCKKEETPSVVPEIAFISVTPLSAKEFSDSLVFKISYRDNDGDLGDNSSNAENLFLTDSRNNVIYKYRISELAPQNSGIAIQGNLLITLQNTSIIDGSNSQTVIYSIYLKDRAGNTSNTVTSPTVTVTK